MKKSSKQLVEMAGSLEELATMICGHGYFAYHNDERDYPIRKEAVLEYLEMGESFSKRNAVEMSVSWDLEEEIQKFIQHDPTDKDPSIENCEDCMSFVFRAGAYCQKQQMMKNVIDGEIIMDNRGINYVSAKVKSNTQYCNHYKVKILIVNEEKD